MEIWIGSRGGTMGSQELERNGIACRSVERMVFGQPIRGMVVETADGVDVLLTGGHKSHIGAVTVMDAKGNAQTIAFPGHREDVVTKHWAEAFHEKYDAPLVVSAGVHYDALAPEDLPLILEILEEMLQGLLAQ